MVAEMHANRKRSLDSRKSDKSISAKPFNVPKLSIPSKPPTKPSISPRLLTIRPEENTIDLLERLSQKLNQTSARRVKNVHDITSQMEKHNKQVEKTVETIKAK